MGNAIFLDIDLCVGCGACVVACMDENDLFPEKGQQAFRRIYQIEGRQSENSLCYISVACQHCEDSPCAMACPTGAIVRDDVLARVTVNSNLCIGCHSCALACPFGVPRYDRDEKMQKCTLCIPRVKAGLEPACVRVCPQGALSFDSANKLQSNKEKIFAVKMVKAVCKSKQ